MTFNREEFEKDKRKWADAQSRDQSVQDATLRFVETSYAHNYGHQWTWLDMPIIQLPADIMAIQELIWKTQPDVIIETGVAWGGSIVYYASLFHLIGKGKVVGVDQVMPDKVRNEIMKYSFSDRIQLVHGPSTEAETVEQVRAQVAPGDTVMLVLDSNHTEEHVLAELDLYAPLVTAGNHLVIYDTIVEFLPEYEHRPRAWSKGDNPYSALEKFLAANDRFERDPYYNAKVLASFAPTGYLRCVRTERDDPTP